MYLEKLTGVAERLQGRKALAKSLPRLLYREAMVRCSSEQKTGYNPSAYYKPLELLPVYRLHNMLNRLVIHQRKLVKA